MAARPRSKVVWYQASGFAALIALAWFTDLGRIHVWLFGTDTPWTEAATDNTLVLLVALPVLVLSQRLAARVRDLEGLLRHDASTRRLDRGERDAPLARLGDGTLAVPWRFALNTWVQALRYPAQVGRVVAGCVREEYEVEIEGGLRVLADGGDLRSVPLCGNEPMRFVEVRPAPHASPTGEALVYRCPRCDETRELPW